MDAEQVLNLLDSFWFNQEIITQKPISPNLENPSLQIPKEPQKPAQISRLPSRHIRSHSDHHELLSSKSISSVFSEFESPKSVLVTHNLQTIMSGKQVTGENPNKEEDGEEEEQEFINHYQMRASKKKVTMGQSRMRRSRGSSKSLSDLEFDELKGFMDLGFVFSEEDKHSSTLISIVPGLQRLGKKLEGETVDETVVEHESLVSRPYLSEAWDVLGQRKEETPVINLKIPALRSEIDMKDQLRCWAHTVAMASTVR